jgi:hypothetical protein
MHIYYLKYTVHNINLKQTITDDHPGKPTTCYLLYWQNEGGLNSKNGQSEGESYASHLSVNDSVNSICDMCIHLKHTHASTHTCAHTYIGCYVPFLFSYQTIKLPIYVLRVCVCIF